MCAVGIDYGTGILCVAKKDAEDKTIVRSERNCFIDVGTDSEDMISSAGYKYIKGEENGEERFYIVGKDAVILNNLFASHANNGDKISRLRRPMSKMVINSKQDKKAIMMLKYMSQSLAGKPEKDGEVCVISIPANPLDATFNNVFHSNMCQSFIKELGYEVYPINEALAVIFAMAPSVTGEDGEIVPMTGISVSWGAGGTNGCLAYRGTETISFAIPRGGDWIDEQVATVCNLTPSEVTVYKEKAGNQGKLDLANPDFSDEIIGAIYIYYQNLITTVVKGFKEQFIKNGTNFSEPIEVVVSGGTSKPNGFEFLVEKIIKENSWPFDIKGVRKPAEPLSTTAIGCLAAAMSKEKKKIQ